MTVFEALYDSEINFSIASFFDGGYQVKLGDEMNGYRAEIRVDTWAEVEAWLATAAIEHYPGSVFAETWQRQGATE